MRNKFKKEERLKSRKAIAGLYERGKSFNSGCYRASWMPMEVSNKFPVQVVISVSKRNFKRAVDRNKIKRRIREAYRKNKASLYSLLEAQNIKIVLALGYVSKEELSYVELENKLIVTLQRLQAEIEKAN